jgi:hypothetical protein
MAHNGSMLGLWIVRERRGQTLLAKVHDEVYVLAFGSAVKATRAREALGTDGSPFLIVAANVRDIVDELRAAGARGFIVDYDAEHASFTSAHPLPSPSASTSVPQGGSSTTLPSSRAPVAPSRRASPASSASRQLPDGSSSRAG